MIGPNLSQHYPKRPHELCTTQCNLNTSCCHSLLLEDPQELPNHTTPDPTRLSVPHLLPLNLVLAKPNSLPLFPPLPFLLPLEEV